MALRLTAVLAVVLGVLAGPANALADIGVVSTVTSAVQQTQQAGSATIQQTATTPQEPAAPLTQATATVTETAAPVAQAAAPVTQAAAPVAQTASAATDAVTQAAAPVTQAVAETTAPVVNTVTQATAPAVETVSEAASAATNTVEQAVGPVVETVADAAKPVVSTIDPPTPTPPSRDAEASTSSAAAAAQAHVAERTAAPATPPAMTALASSAERTTVVASAARSLEHPAILKAAPGKGHDATPVAAARHRATPAAADMTDAPVITLRPVPRPAASPVQPTGAERGPTSARPSSPRPAPFSWPGDGGTTGLSQLTLFGFFAALLAALALAAQRLSRWLRLTPDLWRPLLFVSALERPG